MDASFFKYHSYHQYIIIVTPEARSVTTFWINNISWKVHREANKSCGNICKCMRRLLASRRCVRYRSDVNNRWYFRGTLQVTLLIKDQNPDSKIVQTQNDTLMTNIIKPTHKYCPMTAGKHFNWANMEVPSPEQRTLSTFCPTINICKN